MKITFTDIFKLAWFVYLAYALINGLIALAGLLPKITPTDAIISLTLGLSIYLSIWFAGDYTIEAITKEAI
jgi:hypothetical protein